MFVPLILWCSAATQVKLDLIHKTIHRAGEQSLISFKKKGLSECLPLNKLHGN